MDTHVHLVLGYASPSSSYLASPYLGRARSQRPNARPSGMETTVSSSPPPTAEKLVEVDDDYNRVEMPARPAPPAAAPSVPPAPQTVPVKPSAPTASITDFYVKDLGIKEVDLVVGGKDPTSGAIVAFPVRRMNLISSSSVLADKLKTKPAAFGVGSDSLKNLPFIQLDENASLMERVLPFLYNELDLPKTTDIHFVRAVYQAADKYKMRRLFEWMTEKLQTGWPSAPPEVALNLHAVVKKAGDTDFAAKILDGTLEKYDWTLTSENTDTWTCDSGAGLRPLKDMTDLMAINVLLAIAQKRLCVTCKQLPFHSSKTDGKQAEKKS